MGPHLGGLRHSKALRIIWALSWPFALAAIVFLIAGRLGYNPTDDGYILSQSHRILLGQVPHRDFISPRPDGSAYLHLIDLALPIPRMLSVRIVGLAEILAYSFVLTTFILDQPIWDWNLGEGALATIAFLVNLNVFPLMSWYTTDGIVLIATGLMLLRLGTRRDRKTVIFLGFFALGAAITVKQSFVLAPIVGCLWLLKEPPVRWSRRDWVVAAVAAAGPILIYASYISMEGGWKRMFTQLSSPPLREWGQQLFSGYSAVGILFAIAASVTQAILLWRMHSAEPVGSVRRRGSSLQLVTPYVAIITLVVVFGPLGLAFSTWGLTLLWSLIVLLSVRWLMTRTIDLTGVTLLSLGWMISLSLGYDVPNLIVGAIWLFLVTSVLRSFTGSSMVRIPRWIVAVLVLVSVLFVVGRRTVTYFDVPASHLSTSLRAVSSEFDGIRTGPTTAGYLQSYARCTNRYREPNTAVFPDNPAMYSILGLHNPFPTDWLWPKSLLGSEGWILSVAHRLHVEGHFLVLFQTIPATRLPELQNLPRAKEGSLPFSYGTDLADRILRAVGGRSVVCGPFIGRYSP